MIKSQLKLRRLTSPLTGLVLATALLAIIVLAAVWGRLLSRSAAAEADYLNRKLDIESHLISEGDLRATERLLTETAVERELLDSYLITSDRIAAVLEQLETAAAASSLTMNILNVAAEDRLVVKLDWSGSFAAWFKFLQLVELLPAVVRLDDFSLQPADEPTGVPAGWRGIMTISFLSFITNREN